MKTRGMRPAVVAAALLLAAAALLVGPRRPGQPQAPMIHATGVPDPASGRDAGSTPRPDVVPPVGAAEADDRAPAPASLPAPQEFPEMYATGTAHVPAEPQVEAPTSTSPEMLHEEAPAASSYDSPTGSQDGAAVPQWPVSEPYDRAPTSMPFDAPVEPASDPAVDSQDSSPTEAPPY